MIEDTRSIVDTFCNRQRPCSEKGKGGISFSDGEEVFKKIETHTPNYN